MVEYGGDRSRRDDKGDSGVDEIDRFMYGYLSPP